MTSSLTLPVTDELLKKVQAASLLMNISFKNMEELLGGYLDEIVTRKIIDHLLSTSNASLPVFNDQPVLSGKPQMPTPDVFRNINKNKTQEKVDSTLFGDTGHYQDEESSDYKSLDMLQSSLSLSSDDNDPDIEDEISNSMNAYSEVDSEEIFEKAFNATLAPAFKNRASRKPQVELRAKVTPFS